MDKSEDSTLQGFLIRNFVLILAFVATTESIVTYFMNRYYFPVLQSWFFKGIDINKALNNGEIIRLLAILIVQLLLGGLFGLLPKGVQPLGERILEGLNHIAMRTLPKETFSYMTLHMGKAKAFGLFLFLLAAAVILLMPYVIAAIAYSKIVVDKIRALEEKRDAQKKEFDRRRNLMLSDIAHDLRTPITTVYGYSKALTDGMIADEGQKQEYLMAIQNKSARMSDLIDLLFEYVKLDSDGFELEKEELDLAELLRENAALLFSDIEDAGMELSVEIPEEICQIEADRIQLSRVITNLLVNAMRHNNAGTEIRLSLTQQAGRYCIAVADTGDSISEDIRDHLFDPFSKGDRSRKSGSGSGLGLSIAQKVVQMHGWELKLEQPYKDYTKAFIIKIPNG